MKLVFDDVLNATGALLLRGEKETELSGVSTDTRTLSKGELFLSLQGPRFDGNDHLSAAVEGGAGGLLLREPLSTECGQLVEDLASGLPVAMHPDPRRAFGDLAAWYRDQLDVPVIGITGSCGKTTVKDMLTQLLSSVRRTVGSPSSYNNDVGVPHTLFLADETTEALVVEVGTSGPGEIAALCRIAKPTHGIVTNVGASHLERLGTIEGVAREKSALADSIPREGVLVLNAACRFTPLMQSTTSAQVLTFSVDGSGDFNATDVSHRAEGTSFRLNGREVVSPFLGTHNVQNLLAALAMAVSIGVELDELLPAVVTLEGGRQRMQRIKLGDVTIFDDSYNANPESVLAAARVLAGLQGFERRIFLLGDMLELGPSGAELHHGVGAGIAEAGIDHLILVGDLTKATAAGALEAGLPDARLHYVATAEEASQLASELVQPGDVLLVKGSRAMGLERVVAALRELAGEG